MSRYIVVCKNCRCVGSIEDNIQSQYCPKCNSEFYHLSLDKELWNAQAIDVKKLAKNIWRNDLSDETVSNTVSIIKSSKTNFDKLNDLNFLYLSIIDDGEKTAEAISPANSKIQKPQNDFEEKGKKKKNKFNYVSSDEYLVATLSNGKIENIMSGEGILEERAVLTNKRFYYSYSKGIFRRLSQEDIINIEDISAVKILSVKPYYILVLLVIILFMLLIVIPKFGIINLQTMLTPSIITFLLGIIFFIILEKEYMQVEYAGGHIRFSLKKYNTKNFREFQHVVFEMKDALKK